VLEPARWFYFSGGKVARDLAELESSLQEIPDEEFVFHVNSSKNDFANWIEYVFEHKGLAEDLRHVTEKKDTIYLIDRFLKSHDDSGKESKFEEKLIVAPPDEKEIDVSKMPAPELKADEADSGKKESEEGPDAADDIPDENEGDASAKGDAVKKAVQEDRHTEHELSKEELHALADDAKYEIALEGRQIEEAKKIEARYEPAHKFIVKEFIYGFLLGLVFGLIMLGALMNVNICY
jgi:hypothetical protein